jgi:hypothetical protein
MITIDRTKQIIENEEEGPILDYKEDLILETDGDKAQFVKDVLSLANSGQTAHIIIGVEDGTRKLVGTKTTHKAEQLNDILKVKCDPSLTVEYVERTILGHTVGVIEISGENPPYIVAVSDKYGGHLSSDPKKAFFIERGMVFVRKYNMNAGASRADLDKMFKVKYVTLEADLELTHNVIFKPSDGLTEADIEFFLANQGDVVATDIYVWMQFKNVKEIVRCEPDCHDVSNINTNIPTIQLVPKAPVIRPVRMQCGKVAVKVGGDVKRIETRVIMGAVNMRIKDGSYLISLEKKD